MEMLTLLIVLLKYDRKYDSNEKDGKIKDDF